MAATLDELKNQINQLRKEYQELTGKPAALFDVNNIEQANSAIRTLDGSIDSATRSAQDLEKGFGGVYSEIQSILGELNKSENATNKVTKAFKGVERVARDLKDDQQGFNKLSIKELELRQKKLISSREEAITQANIIKSKYKGTKSLEQGLLLDKNGNHLAGATLKARAKLLNVSVEQLQIDAEIIGQQKDGFRVIEETNQLLQDRIDKENKINESLGLGGAILGSMKGALDKLGMGDLADKLGFAEAETAMRDLGTQMVSSEEEINKLNTGKLSVKQIKAGFGGKELKNLQEQRDALGDMNGKTSILKAGFKSMGGSLLKNLKDPLSIGLMVVTQLIEALKSVDQMTGDVAKNLGMSYNEANDMVSDMTLIATLSGDTYVSTKGLVQAQLELSKSLGTNVQLSSEMLVDFTKLTKQAGYSVETMTQLNKITMGTGKSLQDNTAELLGQAKVYNIKNGLALNEKDIVAEVAKTGAATVLTFGKSAKALTENVMAAKKFGINLEQAGKLASSLLEFESSIEKEMEAELLTGKQLNLEEARLLALKGETGKAAAEVLKQVGSSAEFGNMNVIAQEALANAVGMTRDELAASLIEREALASAGMQDLTLQQAYNKMKKDGLSDDQIAAKLGDENLAAQMKSESVQARMLVMTEKLQEVFVSIAEPIMSIVGPLADLAGIFLPGIVASMNLILYPVTLLADGITGIVESFRTGENVLLSMGKLMLGLVGTSILYKGIMIAINAQKTAGTVIDATGLRLGKGKLVQLAAQAVAFALGNPFRALAGLAIAGTVGVAAYKAVSKAGDMFSPADGKTQISTKEGGLFELSPNDDLIAAPGASDALSKKQRKSSPSINIAPLVEQMTQMNATLNALLSKEGTITLDGTKVGTALNVGSYKLQ